MTLKKIFAALAVLTLAVWASGELYHYAAADIYASVGINELEDGAHYAAQEYFHTSLQYTPGEAENWHTYAEFLHTSARAAKTKEAALNLLKQAQEAYEKSIQLNPLEGNSWLGLGYTCWWLSRFEGFEKEYDGVEASLLRALSTDPSNGEFLYAVAGYYLSNEDVEKGLKYVERLASTFPNAYQHLRKTNYWSDEVRDHFRNGLKLASPSRLTGRNALRVLASIAADEEDWQSAASFTEDTLQRFNEENSPSPYLSLGYYYLKLGSQEKAKAAFLQGLKYSPEPEKTLNNLLWSHKQANTLDTYIALCKEAGQFDQSVRKSQPLFLGKAYYFNSELDLAEESLNRYLKTEESGEAYFYLAQIAYRKKDWDTAEIESQRATVLEPGNSHYYYLFARSLQAQKKFDSALKTIDEAIQNSNPSNHYYYNLRGWIHWSVGSYELAVDDWEKGFEAAPENASYPEQIAMAYKKLEDYEKAEYYYLAAIQLEPKNSRLRQKLESLRNSK